MEILQLMGMCYHLIFVQFISLSPVSTNYLDCHPLDHDYSWFPRWDHASQIYLIFFRSGWPTLTSLCTKWPKSQYCISFLFMSIARHYLDQCTRTMNETLMNIFRWNLKWKNYIYLVISGSYVFIFVAITVQASVSKYNDLYLAILVMWMNGHLSMKCGCLVQLWGNWLLLLQLTWW